MARSQEELLQELIDGNRAILTTLRSGVGKGTTASAASPLEGLTSGFNNLTQSTGGVISAFGTLSKDILTGSGSTLTSLLNFSTAIASNLPVISSFKGALQLLGETGIQQVQGLKESIQYGATFGQDLGLYSKTVAQSRETVDQFNQRIKDSSVALNVLGGNMSDAMTRFGLMAKNLQESELGNNLLLSGWSAKELNDVLATSISVRKPCHCLS